jgi:hypothetical protein
MCGRVTEYPTGVPVPVDEQYYQCLADVAYECLGGEGINILIEVSELDRAIYQGVVDEE